MLEVSKLWASLKLFSEGLAAGYRTIQVYYQTSEQSNWVDIGTYSTSPFEEIDIKDSSDGYAVSRRIRFRLALQTNSPTRSPMLKASIIEALVRIEVKHQYTAYVRIEDHPEYLERKDVAVRAETQLAMLDTWAGLPTPLTMYSIFSLLCNPASALAMPAAPLQNCLARERFGFMVEL